MIEPSALTATSEQETILSFLPDLWVLWAESLGDPEVKIAVLDGPADTSHPCFSGANLRRVETVVSDLAGSGTMSAHGTHVTSLIFGQPNGPALGVAPRCQGLLLPVFRDFQEAQLSQLDLARAIERAVQEGALVINISGGERSPQGQADEILARAIRLCDENNVLVVAAVGNDGCECLHVPAALPAVLAVGAMGADEEPLDSSNWGRAYRSNGILAPGKNIPGAVPGGLTAKMTGSSFATPLVAGFAALLLSLQKKYGRKMDPKAVRKAILESAHKCNPQEIENCRRYLSGSLNIPGACALIKRGESKAMSAASINQSGVLVSNASSLQRNATTPVGGGVVPAGIEAAEAPQPVVAPASATPAAVVPAAAEAVSQNGGVASSGPAPAPTHAGTPAPSINGPSMGSAPGTSNGVVPSCSGCGGKNGKKSNIFAIGTVSYDFGTEARRDTFRQLMPYRTITRPDGTSFSQPPNPYDPLQLCDYLEAASDLPSWQMQTKYKKGDTIVDANGNSQTVMSDDDGGKSGDQAPAWNKDFTGKTVDGDKKAGVTWTNIGILTNFTAKRPNLAESTKLIWTLNLELTPIYALVAEECYADDVYSVLRAALRGESLASDDPSFVGRVSVPGVLTGRTVRLFSGQELPEVRVQPRGLWTWNVNALVDQVVESVKAKQALLTPLTDDEVTSVKRFVQNFLDKVYYELRNLGQSSSDRAVNYSATNVFQAADVGATAIDPSAWGLVPTLPGQRNFYTLDTISVSKSPYCRLDSDCWDVQLAFFDPVSVLQARLIFQFTVDVSDELPVTMGPVRKWTSTAGVSLSLKG